VRWTKESKSRKEITFFSSLLLPNKYCVPPRLTFCWYVRPYYWEEDVRLSVISACALMLSLGKRIDYFFPTVHRNTWRYFCDHVRRSTWMLLYAIFPHKHMEITSMPHRMQENLVITSIANPPPVFLIFNYITYSTVSDKGIECVI